MAEPDSLDRPFSGPPRSTEIEPFGDETTREFRTRVNRDLEYIGRLVFTAKVFVGVAAGFSTLVVLFFTWLVLSITGMEGKIDTLTGVVNVRLDAQGHRIDELERKDGRP